VYLDLHIFMYVHMCVRGVATTEQSIQ